MKVGTVIIFAMRRVFLGSLAALALLAAACGGDDTSSSAAGGGGTGGAKAVVVTYPVLASVVQEVVGDAAPVVVLMPNGTDPHEWKPSPKDVEAMGDALVVVSNGLDLEEGLEDTLSQVREAGVPTFEATDHVAVRTIGEGEASDEEHADEEEGEEDGNDHAGEEGHGPGAEDPHVWMTAENMAKVAAALTTELTALGLDVEASGTRAVADLEALDLEVDALLAEVPDDRRRLVTGHESLGYFADRHRFDLVGAVVPGLSSQAEVSAGDLAELKEQIEAAGVPAIFTELGTPSAVVEAIASETGVEVVELPTHTLPEDGTYRSFLLGNARAVAEALR